MLFRSYIERLHGTVIPHNAKLKLPFVFRPYIDYIDRPMRCDLLTIMLPNYRIGSIVQLNHRWGRRLLCFRGNV